MFMQNDIHHYFLTHIQTPSPQTLPALLREHQDVPEPAESQLSNTPAVSSWMDTPAARLHYL